MVQGGSLSRQLAITLVGVVIGTISLFGLSLHSAMSTTDELSEQRDRVILAGAIGQLGVDLGRDQQSVTNWDEAVTGVHHRDTRFLSSNLGVWMAEFYDHDRAYVIASDGDPVYAMVDGRDADASAYAAVAPALAQLVDKARTASDGAKSATGAAGLEIIDGRLAVVSVKTIVPDSDMGLRSPAGDPLHVAVRYVDDQLLSDMAGRYLIPDLAFTRAEIANASLGDLRIVSDGGQRLGEITWTRRRPGLDMIRNSAPALAAVFLGALAATALLVLRLRKSADDLHRSEARAMHLANHDSLTGLPNRARFRDELEGALRGLADGGSDFCVACLDLDRFKRVNDTLGHPAGDELLRQVAERLQGAVGRSGVVARLSGDEFAAIVRGGDASAVSAMLAEAGSGSYDLMGTTIPVGVSAGTVLVDDPRLGRGEIVRRADLALYAAKHAGRGHGRAFGPDLDPLSLLPDGAAINAPPRAPVAVAA